MTLNFLAKRQFTSDCTHEFQMRMEIAGMSRTVCESCGRVRIGYVEDHFHPESGQELGEKASGSDMDPSGD